MSYYEIGKIYSSRYYCGKGSRIVGRVPCTRKSSIDSCKSCNGRILFECSHQFCQNGSVCGYSIGNEPSYIETRNTCLHCGVYIGSDHVLCERCFDKEVKFWKGLKITEK